ncbi:hypothetical protein [Yeosuana sp.]|uniref:hypothetical protein n=1 Tax=Yeosuana sp. TaxID=2529388 RepID=UPI004054A270|tara:strand:- start:614 stop:1483 length:870 start_codon:yes stop_codon:yes gene_type:complete
MKKHLNFHPIFLAFVSVALLGTSFQNLYAQKAKNTVRLKAKYVKIMDGEIYFDIAAAAKVGKQNLDVSHVDIYAYNEVNDEEIELGKTTTNAKGESKFVLPNLNALKPDSTNTYTVNFSFKGNDTLKKASKSLSFKNADIKAKIITKDSINYISATLIDTDSTSPLTKTILNIQVNRLFKSLPIGDEYNYTDENGTIFVPIEEGIPGVDGILTLEVVLKESNDYGTVKAFVKAPVGVPSVEESTFDERTMWSPRNKTPWFLLIYPNILIFITWGLFVYLIINLFKISKS